MISRAGYAELVPVPRAALHFPIELPVYPGFDPERVETWPDIPGHLEYVDGRLLYMPPSGDEPQDTCIDIARVLGEWRRQHRQFVVGGNEAGMHLAGATRGADAAVWRRKDVPGYRGGVRRAPPVLAVEVCGKYDDEDALREKARWYLGQGTQVVWLLFPRDLRVVVVTRRGAQTKRAGEKLEPHLALPGLAPRVDDLFEQVAEAARPKRRAPSKPRRRR